MKSRCLFSDKTVSGIIIIIIIIMIIIIIKTTELQKSYIQ